MRTIAAAVLLLAGLVLSGCGYHTMMPARGELGRGDKTIEVAIFANRTYRPNIEAVITDSLIDELVRREGKQVVNAGGELVLAGTVLSYGTAAVSYTATDTVKEYRATITVEAALRQVDNGKVLWKGTVSADTVFPANDDLVLQQNSEADAIRAICRKLARDIYLHTTEDF